jgi:hypothetical protein
MSRRRRLLLWLLAAAVLFGELLLAASKPPRLPGDRDHAFDQAEAHCLTCHWHAGKRPRPADHPLRDDCFSCHRDPGGDLHPRAGAPTSLPGGWADDPRLARGSATAGASPSPGGP